MSSWRTRGKSARWQAAQRVVAFREAHARYEVEWEAMLEARAHEAGHMAAKPPLPRFDLTPPPSTKLKKPRPIPEGFHSKGNTYCVAAMYSKPPDASTVPGACQNYRHGQPSLKGDEHT